MEDLPLFSPKLTQLYALYLTLWDLLGFIYVYFILFPYPDPPSTYKSAKNTHDVDVFFHKSRPKSVPPSTPPLLRRRQALLSSLGVTASPWARSWRVGRGSVNRWQSHGRIHGLIV